MIDIIVVLIILAMLGGAVTYIVKAKKKGVKCIGCPDSAQCSAKRMGHDTNCGCGCSSKDDK